MVENKMNYKNSLDIFLKTYFPSEKVDSHGLELISELLNEVNSLLLSHIEAEYNSTGKVRHFKHFARNAIEENFPEELKIFALSEANRQLALLKSGCMVYGEDDTEVIGQEQADSSQTEVRDAQKQIKRRSSQEKTEPKGAELPIRPFKDGIGKMSSAIFPDFKMDSEAVRFLALSIQTFSKMVAERASEKFRQKEELQPVNLKNVLAEYFGDNVLKVAISEGNRCLTLYETGLLAFKPRKAKVKKTIIKASRKSSQRSAVSKKRKSSKIPKRPSSSKKRRSKSPPTGIKTKKRSKKTGPQKKSTSVTPRKAKVKKSIIKTNRKSSQRSAVSKKRKSSKIPKHPPSSKKRRSKSPPTGIKTKKRSKKTGPQKKSTSVTPRKIAKIEKSKTKPSRKSPQRSLVPKKKGSPKRPPSSTKRKSKSSSTGTRRTKKPFKKTKEFQKFATDMMSTSLAEFSSVDVFLADETANYVNGILEDVCQALIYIIVSHTSDAEELDIRCIEAALLELFPQELSSHALSVALNAVS